MTMYYVELYIQWIFKKIKMWKNVKTAQSSLKPRSVVSRVATARCGAAACRVAPPGVVEGGYPHACDVHVGVSLGQNAHLTGLADRFRVPDDHHL